MSAEVAAAAPEPDHADDPVWARRMMGLMAGHPTLEWLKPVVGTGPHVAVWEEDGGAHVERREHLGDLVLYLKARLGRP